MSSDMGSVPDLKIWKTHTIDSPTFDPQSGTRAEISYTTTTL